MKKFIGILAAFFTMLLCCGSPMFVKAEGQGGVFASVASTPEYQDIVAYDLYYIFFNKGGYTFIVTLNQHELDRLNIVSGNGQINISSGLRYTQYVSAQSSYSLETLGSQFNSSTGEAIAFDLNAQQTVFDAFGVDNSQFTDFDTNIPDIHLVDLDLSFRFDPTLSGEVSRTTTLNGKTYTSNTLDLYVTNNAESAQFLMCILPRGESLTFPTSTLSNNMGFNGNPVFVYVSDEWSGFNFGLIGQQNYSPCSWHPIPAGFVNQHFIIDWSQMLLTANTNYDVVIYAALNPDTEQMGDIASPGGHPNYSISSDLEDVQEVFRSSFTILDPAEFNPNYVDERGQSHPWNPNADNTELFNISSAYKDDNGNIYIKGQVGSGANSTFLSDPLGGIDINPQAAFGSYFKLMSGVLVSFPPMYQLMIYMGLVTLFVIAVIKHMTGGS